MAQPLEPSQREDVMAKSKTGRKKTAKVRDLSARKGTNAKGGSQSTLSDVVKSIGDGLTTAARKG